jgi:hypothetical protein
MIQMPRRSVTRFFIPMIDVLILLFCIYLLLPMVSTRGDPSSEAERRALEDRLRALEMERELRGKGGEEVPEELGKKIEELRKLKAKALEQRVAVRVLEIDSQTGKLYYNDPERVEVKDQAHALRLIEMDRQRAGGQKEPYYLILYPRDRRSPYPTREQRRTYDRWFAGVARGYDIPGTGREP